MKKITQKPTSEQQRAIDKATRLKTSFKLIAFAGTGKTTTLIHCSSALQQLGKLGLYLSFNKKMADEANQKFAEYGLNSVTCSTFHSLAYRNIPGWLKNKINKPTLLPKD
ncbi:UvrD-helicase domain-containing protein [Acinetobacter ursingii]